MLTRHIGRVSAIFDGAPIGVAFWSREGQLLHANPIMCELLRRSPEDLVGEWLDAFVDSDSADDVMGMLADVASGARSAFDWPLRCRRENGTDRWLRAHVTGIFGSGTSPEYVISQIFSFIDVRSRPTAPIAPRSDSAYMPETTRWDKARNSVRPTLPHKRWSNGDSKGQHEILDEITVAIAVCDAHGDVLHANRRWREVVLAAPSGGGWGDAIEDPGSWLRSITGESAGELRARIAHGVTTGEPFTMSVFMSGQPDMVEGFWGEVTVTPRTGTGGDVELIVTLFESISGVRSSRISQLADALDASSDLLLFVEADMHISYANDAAGERLGIPTADNSGATRAHFLDVLGGEAAEFFDDVVRPALVYDSTWRGELEMKSADGLPISVSVVLQANARSDGRIDSITVVARDIGDLKAAQLKLQALATHDYLTGLANRVLLHTRLEQALARFVRYGHPVALMYIDLDKFKPVNDRLGHHVGDEVLMVVADRIHSVIRDTDSAARIGGDEFAVLVEGVDGLERHSRLANRLIDVISEPIGVSSASVTVGASIGIVQADGACITPETLMALADGAMYRAKSAGRGRSVAVDGNGHVIG